MRYPMEGLLILTITLMVSFATVAIAKSPTPAKHTFNSAIKPSVTLD